MRASEHGFTLLELLIVVLLIVLITGVFATTIGGGFGVHLRNSARTLAAELEYVSQRAVTTGRTQRFVIDPDHQVFRVEMQLPPQPEADAGLPEHAEGLSLAPPLDLHPFVPVDSQLGEWRALADSDDVAIREVRLGDEVKRDGAVAIGFSIDGGTDPAEILLRDDAGYDVHVRLVAFTGEIRIEEPVEERKVAK
jgi:prepilin-type N-terminal cleavage/methylation domain-containing protein